MSLDTIIIGSGQAGKPLAFALARAGHRVALIEREYVGGTCINVGCTPTKTMVASARVAYLARRARDYGVEVGPVSVDLAAVVARKQTIVERFRNYSTQKLQATEGVDLIFGTASFVDAGTVQVQLNAGGTRTLTAPRIVINTGGAPLVPPIAGLDRVPYLDSTSVQNLTAVPRHLIVIGGGYIGLEFGQMFRRFGAEVTIIQREDRLVPREDADVSEEVAKVLRQDGIRIETSTAVQEVAPTDDGITLRFSRDGAQHSVEGSHLLIAIGRKPNTASLNLAAAGVKTNAAGFIEASDTLETNVPGIFAAGDVKGGPAFTHISYDDFRILRDRWVLGLDARVADRFVPNTMFTDPQLAGVGLTETEARKHGLDIRVAKIGMNGIARALEVGESRGLLKVIVDAQTDRILGATVFGLEGGELMSMLQIAMAGKLPYTVLKEMIFAHPTLAEGLNNVFLALDA
jgi:pyruvate/2-oxoglutarate dehydrogenase complex dihydrolipoamide dehydrogenase (E3) component